MLNMNEETDLLPTEENEMYVRQRVARHDWLQKLCQKLVHVLATLAVILVLVWFNWDDEGFSWETGNKLVFNWHPVLMTVGMVCLFAESAIAYRSLASLGMQQQQKKNVHLVLHTVILLLTIVSLRAIFRFHNEATPPIKNLYSLHSWLGILTVVLFFGQYFVGLYVYFFPRMNVETRKNVLPYHAYVGTLMFSLFVTATVVMGVLEKMTFIKACNNNGEMNNKCVVANTYGIVVIFLGGAVYLSLASPHKSLIPEPRYA
uniref:Cytochrome b561 domain-containing protein n=1 Tax=Aplanochytrium stocchinoi TaxID=215587 RepID=A0A7S3LJI7_9STRA|mmetsp:Transcript_946/g.1188  ORF Transcript_946/g.1188 Transcript_946/m.1188 type:complete len:260 (-) Transcript_946:265-1044(-)